jgi:hypothetical protein
MHAHSSENSQSVESHLAVYKNPLHGAAAFFVNENSFSTSPDVGEKKLKLFRSNFHSTLPSDTSVPARICAYQKTSQSSFTFGDLQKH